jgi:hypothetical protein
MTSFRGPGAMVIAAAIPLGSVRSAQAASTKAGGIWAKPLVEMNTGNAALGFSFLSGPTGAAIRSDRTPVAAEGGSGVAPVPPSAGVAVAGPSA